GWVCFRRQLALPDVFRLPLRIRIYDIACLDRRSVSDEVPPPTAAWHHERVSKLLNNADFLEQRHKECIWPVKRPNGPDGYSGRMQDFGAVAKPDFHHTRWRKFSPVDVPSCFDGSG